MGAAPDRIPEGLKLPGIGRGQRPARTGDRTKESDMAKSQRRSNREAKKPKHRPTLTKAPVPATTGLLARGKTTGTSYKERFK
jgi:hypothetical protein